MKKHPYINEFENKYGKNVDYNQLKEDCINDFINTYEKFINKDKDISSRIHRYFSFGALNFYESYEIGLYEGIKTQNWQIIVNNIFQFYKFRSFPSAASGYDHCSLFYSALLAFSCGDINSFEKLFPKKLGLTKNGHPFVVMGSNLLMILWYKDKSFAEQFIPKVEKYLTVKSRTKEEVSIIGYLLSLYKKDIEGASLHLQNFCNVCSRVSDEDKFFPTKIYGLINLAYHFLSKDLFKRLKFPVHKIFILEFANWLLQQDGKNLKPYINYFDPDNIFTTIYQNPPIETQIYQPYLHKIGYSRLEKEKYYIDIDSMLENITKVYFSHLKLENY